jgi:telomerase reverse transcriptase
MTGNRKRKRNRPGRDVKEDNKRQKISGGFNTKDSVIKQAVLAQYYVKVLSLREYLLSKLPASSKMRRKKILSSGLKSQGQEEDHFAHFLDQTLVGVLNQKHISEDERLQQWTTFSQHIDTSDSNVGNTSALGHFSQSEVWSLVLLYPKGCQVSRQDNRSHLPRSSILPYGCSSQNLRPRMDGYNIYYAKATRSKIDLG